MTTKSPTIGTKQQLRDRTRKHLSEALTRFDWRKMITQEYGKFSIEGTKLSLEQYMKGAPPLKSSAYLYYRVLTMLDRHQLIAFFNEADQAFGFGIIEPLTKKQLRYSDELRRCYTLTPEQVVNWVMPLSAKKTRVVRNHTRLTRRTNALTSKLTQARLKEMRHL